MNVRYELRRIETVAGAFAESRAMVARDRWSRERLLAFQRQRFAELVAYATRHSPFYRRLYGGVLDAAAVVPEKLPTTTKAALLESYDDLVTDRRLRLSDLTAHLAKLDGDELYLGDLRVMASSGSSGPTAPYVYDGAAWRTVIATMLRVADTVGLRPRIPRVRTVNITAPEGKHMTFRATATLDVGMHRTLRTSATLPIDRLVAELNAHKPEFLSAYPSIAAMLATEQLEGRLRIKPRVIVTSSELRTAEMTQRIREAFGVAPHDLYALTETGLVAIECEAHSGMHLFEDTCLYEAVDENNRPVPPGVRGARVLVTNLFNRTQPIIRFEVGDLVTLDDAPCSCGRTTLRLKGIDGRSDDVLSFAGRNGGAVPVHSIHLHTSLAGISAVRDYQITQYPDRLLVSVVLSTAADGEATRRRVQRSVREQLATVGVGDVRIDVEPVAMLAREGAGKLKMVRRVTSPSS